MLAQTTYKLLNDSANNIGEALLFAPIQLVTVCHQLNTLKYWALLGLTPPFRSGNQRFKAANLSAIEEFRTSSFRGR
jgi:hypothetical protein